MPIRSAASGGEALNRDELIYRPPRQGRYGLGKIDAFSRFNVLVNPSFASRDLAELFQQNSFADSPHDPLTTCFSQDVQGPAA